MSEIDRTPETRVIMAWSDRMVERGWCGAVCEMLAEFMGEAGNDSPSPAAIRKSYEWERDDYEMRQFIVERQKWCAGPSVGASGPLRGG